MGIRIHEGRQKGGVIEHIVAAELLKRGYMVLQPLIDAWPYDLAVDNSKRIIRVQVRAGVYQCSHGKGSYSDYYSVSTRYSDKRKKKSLSDR